MTLTFEIAGFCVAKDADKKPNELELAEAIATLLAEQIDVIATISVKYIKVEENDDESKA